MNKTLWTLILFGASLAHAQILTKPQNSKSVPVTDNSSLIMDIYKQTNSQNAQLSGLTAQVTNVKETLDRIEKSQNDSDKKFEDLRHDVDKQGVIANLFVYSIQTFFTIIVAICVTVPGTFFVQKVLNDRFANRSPATEKAA